VNCRFSASAELLSLRVLLDPYPFYHWLRETEPVHWSELLGLWMVTSYPEAVEALRDPRLSSRPDMISTDMLDPGARAELRPLFEMQRRWMQQSDPPAHTSIRAPWNSVFGAAVVERIQPEMDTLARQTAARCVREGELDVIAAFEDFPAAILGSVLGFDTSEINRIKPWIKDYVAFRTRPDLETGRRALQSVLAWREAFGQMLSWQENSAASSLLLQIRGLQSEEQVFATLLSLVSGRYEPTVGLIGNGMLALLQHPDQHPQVLGSKFRVEAAVEEMLRYDCPFQSALRLARADTLIGGRSVKAGQKVLVLLGAANRDPARFAEPDRFLVTRDTRGHLAFGFGVHACLGLHLAREMARCAISAFLDLLPRLQVVSSRPDWQFEVEGFRALRSLLVKYI
jgi:cytochrome P450